MEGRLLYENRRMFHPPSSPGKVQIHSQGPRQLVSVPGLARNSRHQINCDLTVIDLANGPDVLACDTDVVIAFLANVNIIKCLYCFGQGNAIRNIVINIILESVVIS